MFGLGLGQKAATLHSIWPSRAMARAAWVMPLCAAGALPCAVICQLWPGVPMACVATRTSVVGSAQVTSDTSVEPIIFLPPGRSGTTKSHRG